MTPDQETIAEIDEALRAGADRELWLPGSTRGMAVRQLVETVDILWGCVDVYAERGGLGEVGAAERLKRDARALHKALGADGRSCDNCRYGGESPCNRTDGQHSLQSNCLGTLRLAYWEPAVPRRKW